MKVREGDVISTNDGRYGKVVFMVTQKNFLVEIFPEDPLAPKPETPEESWMGIKNVASIR